MSTDEARCRYVQTAAYAGHEQDPRQQRLAADKARRQVSFPLCTYDRFAEVILALITCCEEVMADRTWGAA